MEKKSQKPNPIQMLADAQMEAQDHVVRDRIALIESLAYLKRLHGTDDYDRSVREILEKSDNGVPIQLLRIVHPEAKQLNAVIEKLKKDGAAKEEKVGKTPFLKAA